MLTTAFVDLTFKDAIWRSVVGNEAEVTYEPSVEVNEVEVTYESNVEVNEEDVTYELSDDVRV
jgi:hypothetical protein